MPVWLTNVLTGVLAILGGLFVGYLDLQASEVALTLGLMFLLNMVLGAIAPRGGWYWPFLSVVGVPFLNWFPEFVRLERNPYLHRTVLSYAVLTVILLVAGLLGMLFGVIVRRSIHAPRV